MTTTTIDQPGTRQGPATDGCSEPTQKPRRSSTLHLRCDNPLRPINWRWQRAQLIHKSSAAPIQRLDDEYVGTALEYLRARTGRPDALDEPLSAAVCDAIRQAFEIWEANSTQRWSLEAWLLTGEPMGVVADKLSLSIETVTWYQRLFFDVRDRLQIPSLIIHAAIGREIHNPTPQDVGAIWRLFGYRLGPVGLEATIEDFTAAGRPDYGYLFEPDAEADDMSLERRLLRQAIRVMLLSVKDFRKMLVHTLNDRQTAASVHTWDELMEQLAAPESWVWYAAAGGEDEKPAEDVGATPSGAAHPGEAA